MDKAEFNKVMTYAQKHYDDGHYFAALDELNKVQETIDDPIQNSNMRWLQKSQKLEYQCLRIRTYKELIAQKFEIAENTDDVLYSAICLQDILNMHQSCYETTGIHLKI